MLNIRLERRMETPYLANILPPVISVILALVFCGFFLAATGHNPIKVYGVLVEGAFGSSYSLSETVVKTIPLILASLGISLAFKMKLWNIGAEGQLYMGAMAASGVALFGTGLPDFLVLPAMFVAAVLGGALWGLIPALLHVKWGVTTVITSLLLNYIAIHGVNHLVYGPWRSPNEFNTPLTSLFPAAAQLPVFGATRIHFGLLIALIAAIMFYIILKYTKWGYEVRVTGESLPAARYAGINIARNTLLVMAISGALAGLAGMSEVSGVIHRLQPGISPGYGYTAILVARLARLNPLAVIGVSFLLGALLVGGNSMQTANIPATTVYMVQGAILFFVLAGEVFTRYKIVMKRPGRVGCD